MHVRFAYGAGEGACVIAKVEGWMRLAGLAVHPSCRKWTGERRSADPCHLCGRLFRRMHNNSTVDGNPASGLSKRAVQEALNRRLRDAYLPTAGFTTKSFRKGGLSTAKRAGLPRALRMIQSGHRSDAHKVYESGSDTDDDLLPGVPRVEPRGGWAVEDLYQFSRCFHF